MKLKKFNSILEAVEDYGKAPPEKYIDYVPETDPIPDAVMPISFVGAVKDTEKQRAKANKLIDDRRKVAIDATESDYDDGRLETEETFVFFNENSEMIEREYENGKIDGRDDYATLEYIEAVNIPNAQANKDMNACIVRNTEKGKYENDTEYEGYYLVDRDTLYIVDGDRIEEVRTKLENAINGGYIDPEDKFVLSTKAL